MRLISLISLLAFTASCSAESQAPVPQTQEPPQPQISKIATPEILGTTVKYAEHLIGSPAMREGADLSGNKINTYRMEKCVIELGIDGSNVVSVRLHLINGCDVDVSDIVNKPNTKATETTFKDYAYRGDLHFTDPQLPSCNACGEGPVYALIDGVGATGNYDIQLGAFGVIHDEYQVWRDLLRSAGVDGDTLPTTAEGCPLRKYDEQAFSLMKDFKVESIAFGQRGYLQPACRGN
ncbi:hypothetical protein [Pseudoxanthomonas mexicana]|uniref:hypothetical protein n=1 Tax=Pseudoxanthomonas mexicana TaxID=128785 RepID=UPI00398B50CC